LTRRRSCPWWRGTVRLCGWLNGYASVRSMTTRVGGPDEAERGILAETEQGLFTQPQP
jgi:hypothetical protein